MKTTTKKEKILTFERQGRIIKGKFVAVYSGLIQIFVTEDEEGKYKAGDFTNIRKEFLTEYEDELFIEMEEYKELSIPQKLFGKYYLGLAIFAGIINVTPCGRPPTTMPTTFPNLLKTAHPESPGFAIASN